MENIEEKKEIPDDFQNKEENKINLPNEENKISTQITKEDEPKIENENKEINTINENEEGLKKDKENDNINIPNTKEEDTKKENENKDINKEKPNDLKEKTRKEEEIDPHLIFQKELLNIIKKQEKILTSTSTINEKFGISNEITKEQISSFKTNIDKYGKYLIMIKKELGIISDTMKKIKKLAKENEKDNKK